MYIEELYNDQILDNSDILEPIEEVNNEDRGPPSYYKSWVSEIIDEYEKWKTKRNIWNTNMKFQECGWRHAQLTIWDNYQKLWNYYWCMLEINRIIALGK